MTENNYSKPKPGPKKQTIKSDIYDAVLEVPELEPVAEVEVEVEVEPDIVEEVEVVLEPTPAPVSSSAVPPTTYAVVSNSAVDPVHLSRCIYKNKLQRKSLTVHHLQRRLNEWGYSEAFVDRDGYYGEHTRNAVQKFQDDHDIKGDGLIDGVTMIAIFEGDTNVKVVID